MRSDIEIARSAKTKPISKIAKKILAIKRQYVEPYGHTKAKISLDYLESLPNKSDSKLILVTAISPTPAGEGKTTTTIGLADGINAIGKKAMVCLREPSLGPCFGIKGGAAGGGFSQVIPMEDINLHFTGDFHAITSAHNLLSAAIDNHLHWGNELDIDVRNIQWKRVIDMNDRSLRNIVSALGGKANGYPRQTGFDITVASEIMAILCLAENRKDLEKRLGRIVIGFNSKNEMIRAKDLKVVGAMSVLLKDAIKPNLVQSLENNPAFIHGGPFANIAHGCNSMIATKSALKLSDYVVTEAGFGADLGAEKFFDIKCRIGNLKPNAVVLVATIRALRMHGGASKAELGKTDIQSLKKGLANLGRHIENIKRFSLPVVVAINSFMTDSKEEVELVQSFTEDKYQTQTIVSNHWATGSKGATELAKNVVLLCDQENQFTHLYDDQLDLLAKIEHIATTLYGASQVVVSSEVRRQLKNWQDLGFGKLPICMAKTPYSFSADNSLLGAPIGHELEVREVKLSAGAGFVVVICGSVMTMPGLPRTPSANAIGFNDDSEIIGLF